MYLQLVIRAHTPPDGSLSFAAHISVTVTWSAGRTVVTFAAFRDGAEFVGPLWVKDVFLFAIFPFEIARDSRLLPYWPIVWSGLSGRGQTL